MKSWYYKGNKDLAKEAIDLAIVRASIGATIQNGTVVNGEYAVIDECTVRFAPYHDETCTYYGDY